ncbi:MAG: toll/interleukin-1 receptor domain-containing protein [Mycobacteriaceae bacterium]|nr:toll/interleukin-1 receptor domain-containing protein [Mycobacteriaceae bacterium]
MIFESYGWRDAEDVARRLKDSLERSGYRVWIDKEHLRADDKHFSLGLQQAIADSKLVVALLSPHSVRGRPGEDERSSICYNELRYAEEQGRPIVPVRVQKFIGAPPFLIIKYRRVDWLDWDDPQRYGTGLNEVIDAVTRTLAGDRLFDPNISFQATYFTGELDTAKNEFTGREWLFERVGQWLNGPNRCLLIQGPTGCGKTALTAELVRRNPDGRVLAYHFCTQARFTTEPDAFVRSVAGMLAHSIDAYAEKLWKGDLARLFTADPDTMLREGVLAQLRDIPVDGTYCIVVDALDEAVGSELSIPAVLSGALARFPAWPAWLKLLVTTRPQQDVQLMFPHAETCALDAENENHLSDLGTFIGARLIQAPFTGVIEPGTRAEIAKQVALSAAGNFQYADSVLHALANDEISAAEPDWLPSNLGQLYFDRALRRFPHAADYRFARELLGVLLAAREPLTRTELAALTGLGLDTQLHDALQRVSCFTSSTANAWGIAHKSIADWLVSARAGRFTVDAAQGRQRVLAYCVDWAKHHEPYALKHVIAHLLEAGKVADAVAAVHQGLFDCRSEVVGEPRLDMDDSRNLTAALIALGDTEAIVGLAKTTNTWQRDGVASALQGASPDKRDFIDGVVGALLMVSA